MTDFVMFVCYSFFVLKDVNLAFFSQVKTDDGFLLSVQHIPHGKNGVADNAGPPVFLQHGLFQVSPR